MAIWAGSAINTDELTMVVNQVYNKKFIDQVKENQGYMAMALGKPDALAKQKSPAFEKIKSFTGKNIEVKLLGNYAEFDTLADGAPEVASTVGVVTEKYGAAEFAPTHFNKQHWIPKSQWKRFRGQEAKTLNFVQDEYDWLMASWVDALSIGMSSTDNQSRTTLGGWEYAVDDGTTYDSYGTITRSDAGNVDFRAHVKSSFGAFTLDALQTELTTVWGNGGKPNVFVAGEAVFGYVMKAARDEGTLVNNYGSDGTVNAGGTSVSWAGMTLLLDKRTTAGVGGMLDTRSFFVYMDEEGMENELMVDRSKKSALMFSMEAWVAHICKRPKSNGKITGASA